MNRRLTTTIASALAVAVATLTPVVLDPSVATGAPGAPAPPSPDPLPQPWMRPGEVAAGAYTSTRQPVVDPTAISLRRATPATRTVRVVADSAWSWFMDPRVLGTSRSTVMSSVRNNGDIQVTSVDRGTARLRHTVLAADFQEDDHNAPSLTEMPDGRIAAFWNGHGTVAPRYRITRSPGDVTTFGPTTSLKGSGLEHERVTYTSIMQLRGNAYRYHLFTRRTRDQAWVLTRSKDLKTWTPAIRLFDHPTRDNVPYPKFVTTGWDTVHIAVSDTTATAGQRSSMYHLSLTGGVFRQSNGRVIRTLGEVAGSAGRPPRPIAPREATLVYDGRSADGRARVYDIALQGNVPTLVLTTGAGGNTGVWTYKWFRRPGAAWVQRTLDRSTGTLPSGITLRHDDPGRVFLSTGGAEVGRRELVELRTHDDGSSWVQRAVTSGSTQGNRTPATPWGAQDGPVSVAWLAGPYTAFNQGRWQTTVTMETSERAPIDLRTSWPAGWSTGAGLTSRVTAGVGGPGVRGVRAWLLVRKPGGAEVKMHSAVTDSTGRVHLVVNRYYPKGTRVRVQVPAAGDWGYATTPSRPTGA